MTDINKIRAALAAATPGPWHSKGWLATREETDEADRTGVEDLITDANGKRVVGASWYDGEHIACTEPDAALIASSPSWLAELCDRVEKAEADRDAALAERDALGESLTTLVYWHDRDGIDESWWTDARELLSAHAKASGGEHG